MLIRSAKQLLKYAKVVNSNCRIVHTLCINVPTWREDRDRSFSTIGSTILLISKLPNLQQLEISCYWHNDHHPKVLKLLPNTSVKILKCSFTTHIISTWSILEFITHFQSIQDLSLSINKPFGGPAPSCKVQSKALRRALLRTKICIKQLHLNIFDPEIFKLVVKAFIGAKDFVSHISKHSHNSYSINPDNCNAYHELLLHCSSSLQVFSHEGYEDSVADILPGK